MRTPYLDISSPSCLVKQCVHEQCGRSRKHSAKTWTVRNCSMLTVSIEHSWGELVDNSQVVVPSLMHHVALIG